MTNSHNSKATSLFLILSVLLALVIHAFAARSIAVKHDDKLKPDCFGSQPEGNVIFGSQPDGSVIIPGVGRVYDPNPGTISYNPPGDSTPQLGGEGTPPTPDNFSPLPGGEGTLTPPTPADSFSPLPGGDGSPPLFNASPPVDDSIP